MNTSSQSLKTNNLFRREVPLFLVIIIVVATGLAVYFLFPKPSSIVMVNASNSNDCPQKMDEIRLKDYKFTHPLVLADLPTENSELSGLKDKIVQLLDQDKNL